LILLGAVTFDEYRKMGRRNKKLAGTVTAAKIKAE
jgi:hypothetical protein